MHTDGIHFIDLINWILDDKPKQVYGITRDHFNRGLEHTAVGLFFYKNNIFSNIESGYIQPGLWNDKVIPNKTEKMTNKKPFSGGIVANQTSKFSNIPSNWV